MSSVGERLRLERQKQGLTLADVAEKTRISQRYVTAIEAGDIKSLPGEFFYRSFVRQYAKALGLEETEFENELQQLFPVAPPEHAPAPVEQPRIAVPPIGRSMDSRRWPWSLVVLAAVIVACTALYAWWQRLRTTPVETARVQVTQQEQPSAPPQQPPATPSAETPPPQPGGPAAAQPSEPAPGSPAQPSPAPVSPAAGEPGAGTAQQAVPETAAPKPAEPGTPAATPPAPPKEIGEGDLALEITASADTWFSFKSGGKTLFSNVLKAGQSRTMRAAGAAELLIGNAGGLNIVWNGKPLGPIGPSGQVRRVRITAEGVQVSDPRTPKREQPEQTEIPPPVPHPP